MTRVDRKFQRLELLGSSAANDFGEYIDMIVATTEKKLIGVLSGRGKRVIGANACLPNEHAGAQRELSSLRVARKSRR